MQPAWRPAASVVRLCLDATTKYVCVCVCIVLVTACQTAHCLCGKANMKGVKVHKQRRLMQYMHDYQDVQYVYI